MTDSQSAVPFTGPFNPNESTPRGIANVLEYPLWALRAIQAAHDGHFGGDLTDDDWRRFGVALWNTVLLARCCVEGGRLDLQPDGAFRMISQPPSIGARFAQALERPAFVESRMRHAVERLFSWAVLLRCEASDGDKVVFQPYRRPVPPEIAEEAAELARLGYLVGPIPPFGDALWQRESKTSAALDADADGPGGGTGSSRIVVQDASPTRSDVPAISIQRWAGSIRIAEATIRGSSVVRTFRAVEALSTRTPGRSAIVWRDILREFMVRNEWKGRPVAERTIADYSRSVRRQLDQAGLASFWLHVPEQGARWVGHALDS